MTRGSIREYLAVMRPRYLRASRPERGWMLDEAEEVTGYQRTLRLAAHGSAFSRAARGVDHGTTLLRHDRVQRVESRSDGKR